MEPTIVQHIERTPGVCGGKPRVAGTRIRVQDIVVWTEQGLSPDEIVLGYPHLTLADVHAALAFYHDHRAEIDEDMRKSDEFIAAMKRNHAPPPASDAQETNADEAIYSGNAWPTRRCS